MFEIFFSSCFPSKNTLPKTSEQAVETYRGPAATAHATPEVYKNAETPEELKAGFDKYWDSEGAKELHKAWNPGALKKAEASPALKRVISM
jgi:hypothetical protein